MKVFSLLFLAAFLTPAFAQETPAPDANNAALITEGMLQEKYNIGQDAISKVEDNLLLQTKAHNKVLEATQVLNIYVRLANMTKRSEYSELGVSKGLELFLADQVEEARLQQGSAILDAEFYRGAAYGYLHLAYVPNGILPKNADERASFTDSSYHPIFIEASNAENERKLLGGIYRQAVMNKRAYMQVQTELSDALRSPLLNGIYHFTEEDKYALFEMQHDLKTEEKRMNEGFAELTQKFPALTEKLKTTRTAVSNVQYECRASFGNDSTENKAPDLTFALTEETKQAFIVEGLHTLHSVPYYSATAVGIPLNGLSVDFTIAGAVTETCTQVSVDIKLFDSAGNQIGMTTSKGAMWGHSTFNVDLEHEGNHYVVTCNLQPVVK